MSASAPSPVICSLRMISTVGIMMACEVWMAVRPGQVGIDLLYGATPDHASACAGGNRGTSTLPLSRGLSRKVRVDGDRRVRDKKVTMVVQAVARAFQKSLKRF